MWKFRESKISKIIWRNILNFLRNQTTLFHNQNISCYWHDDRLVDQLNQKKGTEIDIHLYSQWTKKLYSSNPFNGEGKSFQQIVLV